MEIIENIKEQKTEIYRGILMLFIMLFSLFIGYCISSLFNIHHFVIFHTTMHGDITIEAIIMLVLSILISPIEKKLIK